ncbi:hypothetical protein MFMK1_001546 [Metallumcola ferriviriculae]|uniref:Uncharacterized protein n=1 Tax=Metallumcola ferriviriculae TaxID=3039180 RepID=A0AAU0UNG9_9FIRM|nr:hypothetical protein MFMK1_001546 [Desulfitibacteraceae bacterium MK1]
MDNKRDKRDENEELAEELMARAGSINPNMKSSAHLALDRFRLAMSLNPADTKEAEELRNRLTEEEGYPGNDKPLGDRRRHP